MIFETWLIFRRAMRLSLRNPVWVILGLIQPILYLALFGPLLKRVVQAPGFPPGDAWQVFVPGLLVQLGIFGAAFSSASYAAALILKSEDALAPLFNGLFVPILLLSGILLPMSLAPAWLRTVSDVNPLKHVVDGVRALFLGHVTTITVLWGLLATAGLVIAGVALGTRTFQRESS